MGDPACVVRCAIKHILLLLGLKYFLYVEELYDAAFSIIFVTLFDKQLICDGKVNCICSIIM